MEYSTRIRSLLVTTITMFVTLSFSRCSHVQSLQLLRPLQHRGTLGGCVATRNNDPLAAVTTRRLNLIPVSLFSMRRPQRWSTTSTMFSSSSSSIATDGLGKPTLLSKDDRGFLKQALEHAAIGRGHTFPNPAVGCVLVKDDTDEILGAGFHPKAGYPHAEIFALLEAAGHLESGVASAKGVVEGTPDDQLAALVEEYTSSGDDGEGGGPERLFGGAMTDFPVTAYVTLEPCCHYGKTPPCAASLVLAGVSRVVVGFRDPNPKVDGGGVKVLEEAGILVDIAKDKGCATIVDSFAKRILPKDYDSQTYSHMNGVLRRGLRKLAGQMKNEQTLQQVAWSGKVKATSEEEVNTLEFSPEWMEHVDDLLWREELVNIRLNKAVKKKKLAKLLGNRLASSLGAHVAQVVGHTVLLYRPAMPHPVLDLEELVATEDLAESDDGDDDE